MKKISISFLMSMVLLSGGALGASAQSATTTATTTSSTTTTDITSMLQAQVAALLQQIEQLKAQLAALQVSNANLQTAVQTLQLSTPLSLGMQGEEVKQLQEVLATDRNIFSKENITGYYGHLTEEAVKYFQKHFGIDPVGAVGPVTMKKINEILKEHNAEEGNLSENDLGDLGDTEDMNTNDEGEGDHTGDTSLSTSTPASHHSDSESDQ